MAQEEDDIWGIAPLMLSKYSFMSVGTFSKIEFIGSPDSDYNNLILLKNEAECARLFLDHLIQQDDWDCLELRDVREGTLSAKLLREVRPSAWKLEQRVATVCPYVELPNSVEDFRKKLGGIFRKNMRRQMRNLAKKYGIGFKTYADFPSIEEAFDVFFDLHQRRWRAKGKPGRFFFNKDFHKAVARDFADKQWLSMYFLTANDEPVACIYSFDYAQKNYFYQSGFDPRFGAYGVGTLLSMYAIETSIQKGLKEYDFMRGDERYKRHWPSKVRSNFELQYIRKGWFAKLYAQVRRSNAIRTLARNLGHELTLQR